MVHSAGFWSFVVFIDKWCPARAASDYGYWRLAVTPALQKFLYAVCGGSVNVTHMNVRVGQGIIAAAVCVLTASPLSAVSVTAEDFDTALRADGDRERGEVLFRGCMACHASDGNGGQNGDTPSIAGQHRSAIIKQLVDFRHGMRWDVRMERIADKHQLPKPQDMADVAAYVSSMPVQPTSDYGNGELVEHGRAIFAQLCASCHGSTAAGSDARHVPRLGGQSYQYLLRQMYNTVDNRRPNLAGEHVTLFKRFARDEFLGTADYLSRLSP